MSDIKDANTRNEHLQRANSALVTRNAELTEQLDQLVVRVDGKNLKARGDWRLWRSMNYGYASGESLVRILDIAGDKTLVYRSVRRGGAAHYIQNRDTCDAFRGCGDFRCIVVCSDAFSSKTARTDCYKLQVTECVVGPFGDCTSKLLIPDLMQVSTSDGCEFVENLQRQLENLNLPTWLDTFTADDPFTVFVFVGDDGSDVDSGVCDACKSWQHFRSIS